ncbi:MAG: hypothetical protein JOY93_01010 [Acidobacteriales bacterium]|nr:hypothetical protein [Terriglobales bacterium]
MDAGTEVVTVRRLLPQADNPKTMKAKMMGAAMAGPKLRMHPPRRTPPKQSLAGTFIGE